MKFLVAIETNGKELLKIELDDGQQVWMTTTSKVFSYAKNNFRDGDQAGVEYTVKNNQYFCSRITKGGQSTQTSNPPANTSSSVEGHPCEACGANVKNDTYKKCYHCNKKKPAKTSTTSGKWGELSKEEENRRARLTSMASACEAVKVMTGQIDSGALGDLVENLYERFYNKIKS